MVQCVNLLCNTLPVQKLNYDSDAEIISNLAGSDTLLVGGNASTSGYYWKLAVILLVAIHCWEMIMHPSLAGIDVFIGDSIPSAKSFVNVSVSQIVDSSIDSNTVVCL
jgi:hypothetical protein